MGMRRVIDIPEEIYNYLVKDGIPPIAGNTPYNEALKAIFYSMPVEECEEGGCISRDDVKILLRKEFPNMTNRTYNALWDEVDTLPSVYPKSDMGRYDPYTDKFIKE